MLFGSSLEFLVVHSPPSGLQSSQSSFIGWFSLRCSIHFYFLIVHLFYFIALSLFTSLLLLVFGFLYVTRLDRCRVSHRLVIARPATTHLILLARDLTPVREAGLRELWLIR